MQLATEAVKSREWGECLQYGCSQVLNVNKVLPFVFKPEGYWLRIWTPCLDFDTWRFGLTVSVVKFTVCLAHVIGYKVSTTRLI